MSDSLIIRPRAEENALSAFQWYEDKSTGLGDEFLVSLDSCINLITKHPNIFQKKYKNIRMGILDRFPFGVYYLVDEDTIVIMAILHFSRNPAILKDL